MRNRRYLFDVDGPLADFHRAARDLIEKLFGLRFEISEFRTWDVTSVLGEENRKICNEAFALPGFASSIQPFPEAIKAVKTIRARGDEVFFVTTPHKDSTTWVRERENWLMEHYNASHDEFIHAYRKYAVIGDVFLDDKPFHVHEWKKHHPNGRAILYGTSYNSNESGLERTSDWDEILK